MELLLIRHALPERVEGVANADPPLDRTGQRQAQALGSWLADEQLDEQVDAVYTSPLLRAVQTAAHLEPIAGRATVRDGLAEFDRGFDFYIPMEDLKAENHPHWQVMAEGRWDEIPGDLLAFRDRVVDAIEEIVADNPGRRVAVVCHGGVINAYVGSVLGVESPLFFEPAYTSISRVEAARSGPRSIRSLNEAAHLRRL